MNELPPAVRPALRRLSRRLAIGLFLDVWPAWTAISLFLAGLIALLCRMFIPAAAPYVRWLWLAPVLTALAALIACYVRAYRPSEIVALADWLGGGQGVLLTLSTNDDPAWAESPLLEQASRFALPRLRPWRKLAPVLPALAFLAGALWLPQRTPAHGSDAALADHIAADLTATVTELKQQALVTPEEEKKLEDEIERIRRGAQERVDASSWEAADALREKVVAGLAEKQNGVKWAEESLARFQAAAEGGANAESNTAAQAAELTKALEALAKSGLMASAPPDLQRLLRGGTLPADPGALRDLAASVSKYLGKTKGRLAGVAKLGKEFGRFDPAEFPLESGEPAGGEGEPGRGGINRGRADAPLTWGAESMPFDRFKAQALPPGAARSPDDWAPVVVLPGAPRESAAIGTAAAAART